MKISPIGTPLQPGSSHTASGRISGRWLPIARGVWVVCALLLLANFVASIPTYFKIMQTVCTLPDSSKCATGQLTPDTVHNLAYLHLSLSSYAIFFVTLEVLLSLLPWGLGLLIFWRKSNEWIGLGAFLLTFPTGRFVPRWSWLVLLFWIINFLLNQSPTLLYQVFQGAIALMAFGGTLFIMIYRYVRVFDGVERQQAKWFVYAAVIFLCLLFIGTTPPGAVPANSAFLLLFPIIILFSSAIFYFGLGFAILRYRLYEIDRIINRTLVYSLLTIILLAIYLGLIFALQYLLQGIIKQENDVAIVVSTLIISALFQPLRHRIQRIIDRRFYRSKYNAAKIIANFSSTLREEVDLDTLSEHLIAIVW